MKVVMVIGADYREPTDADRGLRDKRGHFMGCIGGAGCDATRCRELDSDNQRGTFEWMTLAEAKRSNAQVDTMIGPQWIRGTLKEIEDEVAVRIADWLAKESVPAWFAERIRRGEWR